MKQIISILCLAIFSLLSSNNSVAQDQEQQYVVVEYMKVKPGMMEKYRECEKAWKMIHDARLKAGYITGWELERVVSPNGMNSEYDFVTITQYKNWNAIDAEDRSTFGELFKALPEDMSKIADNAEDYRDLVKKEIWAGQEIIFAPGAKNPKYRVENFMSLPKGGWNNWFEMESTFAKPFIEKSIELGNRAGWLIGSMIMPRGDEFPYQVSTIDFYDSWEDMGKSDEAAWKAVHGDMDEEQIGKRIEASRTIVRSEVRVLVDFVD